MAMTHFLLHSSQQTLHLRSFPSKCHHSNTNNNNIVTLKKNNYYYHSPCFIKTSSKFNNIKCFYMNHKPQGQKSFGENIGRVSRDLKKVVTDKNGVIWRTMENLMQALNVSVLTVVLLGLWYLCCTYSSRLELAASSIQIAPSSCEVHSTTHASCPPCSSCDLYTSNPALYYAALVLLLTLVTFPIALVSYLVVKGLTPHKRSVLKLQVGLLGTYGSLRSDLKQIADASTSKGLSYVLQEAALALLRHPDHCISGYSSVDIQKSKLECEMLFNHCSIEERSKLDVVNNANDITKKSATSQSSNNEYTVVTIIVAVDGVPELPPIKSTEQLTNALQNLGSIPSRYIMKVKLFWNPKQDNNFLTAQELLEDYPLLYPI